MILAQNWPKKAKYSWHGHCSFKYSSRRRTVSCMYFNFKRINEGTGMAQWWEKRPPIVVSRVRFSYPASYVGWVCCWFSPLLRELFLQVLRFLHSSINKPTFPNSNAIWIIVKHFIMSLWLGWSRKHSLCLTLNLHLHLSHLKFYRLAHP